MSKALWRIAAVTVDYPADELSGIGAGISGGRWNSIGTPMLYCSESIALAVLETLAHLRDSKVPFNRYLVKLTVPARVWRERQCLLPPPGWDARPHGIPSIALGDAWCASNSAALLQVPSVIVPEEYNVLINPRHTRSASITASILRRWEYDFRLF